MGMNVDMKGSGTQKEQILRNHADADNQGFHGQDVSLAVHRRRTEAQHQTDPKSGLVVTAKRTRLMKKAIIFLLAATAFFTACNNNQLDDELFIKHVLINQNGFREYDLNYVDANVRDTLITVAVNGSSKTRPRRQGRSGGQPRHPRRIQLGEIPQRPQSLLRTAARRVLLFQRGRHHHQSRNGIHRRSDQFQSRQDR